MSRGGERRTVRAAAPAKVNLGLEILGRRDDGFHEVRTTLLALDLVDDVEVRLGVRRGGIALEVCGEHRDGVPADATNLVWRAAEMVRELARHAGHTAADRRLTLRLEKRIPAGAGLGGGSSDAAATMLAAARAFELEVDDDHAAELLAQLGSDCPFFWSARTKGLALATGRGEVVHPCDDGEIPWWFLVVTPEITCATGEVYAALAPPRGDGSSPRFDLARMHGELDDARLALVNDLEDAAFASHPALAAWHDVLTEVHVGGFRLAGSGSSCFGIFASRAAAESARARVVLAMKARDYGLRGAWVLRAAGGGARIVSDE